MSPEGGSGPRPREVGLQEGGAWAGGWPYPARHPPGRGGVGARADPLPSPQYGIKKKEEREAEAQAALEANSEGSLTRPKKAIPPGCGDAAEEEDESILDTVIKYLPGPLQDIFKK